MPGRWVAIPKLRSGQSYFHDWLMEWHTGGVYAFVGTRVNAERTP